MRPVRIQSKEVFSVPTSKFNVFHLSIILVVLFHITIDLPQQEEVAEASQLLQDFLAEEHPAAAAAEGVEAAVAENPYFYRRELQSNLNAILVILLRIFSASK